MVAGINGGVPLWHYAARYLLIVILVWFTARLVLSLLFGRLLHGKLHIGRVGWLSLNNIQWDLIRHTRPSTSHRVQAVHIDRIGLVFRSGGAKDGSAVGLGWFGIAVRGVRVKAALVSSREQDQAVAGEAAHPASSPLNAESAPTTPGTSNERPQPRVTDAATASPYANAGIRQLVWSALAVVAYIHDLRRALRRLVYNSIPVNLRRRGTRFWRSFRHTVISPVLAYANRLARSSNVFTAFLALEVRDFIVELPQPGVALKIGLARFGIDLVRGRWSYLGTWLRFESLAIVALAEEASQTERAALHIPGPVLVDAQAFFDPAIGIAGLYHRNPLGRVEPRQNVLGIAVSFPVLSTPFTNAKTTEYSLNINLGASRQIIRGLNTCKESVAHLRSSPHSHMREESDYSDAGSSTVGNPSLQSPLAMLKSFSIGIPLIRVEEAIGRSACGHGVYGLECRLKSLAVELALGGMADHQEKHTEWFGKQAGVKGTAKAGFESIEVDLTALSPNTAEAIGKPTRMMTVSPSGMHLTTSWLPERLDALLSSASDGRPYSRVQREEHSLFPEDHSVNRLIFEADLGGIHGEASIDLLQDLISLYPLEHQVFRQSSHGLKHAHDLPQTPAGRDLHIYNPPALNIAIELGRSEYRIVGPRTPHRTAFGPGEDDAGISPGWQAPSIVCVHLPAASAHMSTRYLDLTVKRTETQRRDLKHSIRRGKVLAPEILVPYLDGDYQDLSASRGRQGHGSASRNPESSTADFDTISESVSPVDSPGPRSKFASKGMVELRKSAFVSPADVHGSLVPLASSLHRADEHHLRSHPFVFHIETHIFAEKAELYLLSSDSLADDVRSNPTSAGPSTGRTSYHPTSEPRRDRHARSHSKPTFETKHSILSVGPLALVSRFEVFGKEVHDTTIFGDDMLNALLDLEHKQGNVHVQVESIRADCTKLRVFHALNGVAAVLSTASASRRKARREQDEETKNAGEPGDTRSADLETARPRAFFLSFPADVILVLSLNDLDLHIAGPDPKYNPSVCRGLAFQAQNITLEGFRQSRPSTYQFRPQIRAMLALNDDIRAHANAEYTSRPYFAPAYFRTHCTKIVINPLRDTAQHSKMMRAKSAAGRSPSEANDPKLTWELRNRRDLFDLSGSDGESRENSHSTTDSKDFFDIPAATLRITIWAQQEAMDAGASQTPHTPPDRTIDHIGINFGCPSVVARIELFQVYCFLMAFSAFRSLLPQYSVPPAPSANSNKQPSLRPRPSIVYRGDVHQVHVYLSLPHNVRTFAMFRRIKVDNPTSNEMTVKFDTSTMAGASLASPGKWDEIIRMRGIAVTIAHEPGNSGYQPWAVYVNGTGGRLRLPFKYPFSIIMDNMATFIKTVKQLVHQFVKGRYGLAIEPRPEAPKRLPKIRVALKVLVLEAMDDPFETRLNLIWRAGVEEQAMRLSREKAFEDKIAALRLAEEERQESVYVQGANSAGRPKPRVSPEDAYAALQNLNSRRWIKRHRTAMATRKRREDIQSRRIYGSEVAGSAASAFRDSSLPIKLVNARSRAPLLRWVMENPLVEITRPTFDKRPDGLVNFLAEVGKGMPRDTEYSLIVPFHLNWQMSEARIHLRDYPLPLIYIPPVQHPHSEAKSWQLVTDFVIAEEMGDRSSIRYVPATIVPRELAGGATSQSYDFRVPRTAMPVKTYALPVINITSTWATRFGWGNSIQPTIQDVMRVLDSLTKAPPDPSERMGFWDKLRMILHWRISINFLGTGPLHFILKGSRDPYSLQGNGAGFALCWSGNIRWTMGFPNDDNEFFQIHSDSFILGIPDLKDYVDAAATGVIRETMASTDAEDKHTAPNTEAAHLRAYGRDQSFEKVCAKFLGGVKWGLGLRMERTCREQDCTRIPKCSGRSIDRQCRFFDFRPHYSIRTISGADHPHSPHHDSFAGFRSDFVHFSISVESNNPGKHANSIHLTPIGFTHFWSWWHLFDGTLSLPVRHGRLFPSTQAPSKKFGKHCATIKYRCQLAPVYIAHTYKQESWEDWHRGHTTVLGIKGRIDAFNVDLHQREQEESVYNEHLHKTRTRLHKPFFRAEVDCLDTDLRMLAARFVDTNKSEIHADMNEEEEDVEDPLGLDSDENVANSSDPWVDLDDFYDLYFNMTDPMPRTRVVRCFRSPRLTYSRFAGQREDHNHAGESAGDAQRAPISKFGNEPTHTCLLNKAADAVDVQLETMQDRLDELQEELDERARPGSRYTANEVDEAKKQYDGALRGLQRVKAYRDRRLSTKINKENASYIDQDRISDFSQDIGHAQDLDVFQDLDLWINRLVIHNPNVVVTQTIRDILLRYYYSSRNRRLFEYTLTSRAIKFIKELAHEPDGKRYTDSRRAPPRRQPHVNRTSSSASDQRGHPADLLEKMLNDEGVNWTFNDKSKAPNNAPPSDTESQTSGSNFDLDPSTEAASDLPDHWGVRNSFLVSLLKPQVALESDVVESSTVILTSTAVQFRVFNIVDEQHLDDPINSQVMHRTFGSIDSLQAFYPHLSGWRSGKRERVLSSLQFVPLEVLAGCADDPNNLDRIVPRTSARLRYDKHNRLRLLNDTRQKGTGRHGESWRSTLDRLVVECERFSVSATPKHYGAIYEVITNLILYTDPGQKVRNQKIERVVLSKDFSNRQDIAAIIGRQQDEIRTIREHCISLVYKGIAHLSPQETNDLYLMTADLTRRIEIITMWMGAIQRAQDSLNISKSMGMQMDARANEIVWHMRESEGTALLKIAVKGAAFRWLNRSDGSVSNCLLISDLVALNSSPEQYFPEIISKTPSSGSQQDQLMRSDLFVAVLWSMLTPVGGINVVDRFEVHLHPVRLQLEQQIANKIMNYLFSQRQARKKQTEVAADSSGKDDNAQSGLSAPLQVRRRGSSTALKAARSTESLVASRNSNEGSRIIHGVDNQSLHVPSSASSSVFSSATMTPSSSRPRSLRHVSSSETLAFVSAKSDDHLDAEEMRERARINRAFHHIEIYPTVLNLSFKGDKSTSLPDLYGLVYKSPTIIHCNRIWTYLDLLEHIKRDFKSSIWSQSATLIGQLLTSARKPKNVVQQHVQQRLLGKGDRDRDIPEDSKKRRSITSSIRARITSGNADSPKASPLRSSIVRQPSEGQNSESLEGGGAFEGSLNHEQEDDSESEDYGDHYTHAAVGHEPDDFSERTSSGASGMVEFPKHVSSTGR